jgi:type II secretory ATPase GspE/PulE/Tfp pilus assembly ATPase PilB-like protein
LKVCDAPLNNRTPTARRKLDQLRFDAKALQKSFEGILSRHQQLVRLGCPDQRQTDAARNFNRAMPTCCGSHILS